MASFHKDGLWDSSQSSYFLSAIHSFSTSNFQEPDTKQHGDQTDKNPWFYEASLDFSAGRGRLMINKINEQSLYQWITIVMKKNESYGW
jgi:hypothetical protein